MRGDVGAALSIYRDGKPVVDLWGGWADAARTRRWAADTIASCASTSKGLTSACAHRLVERGVIDLDKPVAHYWPEFAQAGKGAIPVRWLLCHRAGLPAIRRDMPPDSLYDWNAFCAALAAETPWWEPGSQHGYHATTFGYLIGEVARRASGKTIGQIAKEEICGPLGADFHIGVPVEDDARAAEILPEPPGPEGEESLIRRSRRDPQSLAGRVFGNPARDPAAMNSRRWRAAEIPASNGHASARGVARLYAALALGGRLDGVQVLERETIERAADEQAFGPDAVLGQVARYGLGFRLRLPGPGVGIQSVVPNPRAFGHTGRGGSIGFADREARIGFGYVMNQYVAPTPQHPDLRWQSLAKALYAGLA
jgi:CubicO group peptidase (beta-lactamase class C family)